jgi:DNA-binding transcriptional LysR family regulator
MGRRRTFVSDNLYDLDDAFAKLKLTPQIKFEVDSNDPLLELIIAGEGLSILPFSAIAGKSRLGHLSAAKIIEPEIQRKFMLITALNRPFPAVCREATHQIRLVMQKHASEARWVWEP